MSQNSAVSRGFFQSIAPIERPIVFTTESTGFTEEAKEARGRTPLLAFLPVNSVHCLGILGTSDFSQAVSQSLGSVVRIHLVAAKRG